MKSLLLVHLCLILLCSCNLITSKDKVQTFIPGTYIRFSHHEYGTEYDTLVITLQNKSAGEYNILRKWRYERILDGKAIEPEYKQTNTSGVYNSKHKLLQETESGDFISFDPPQNLLFIRSSKYKKL